MDYLRFYREFLRNKRNVGSLVPSSENIAHALVYPLERALSAPDVASLPALHILEVGPGPGPVTKHILPLLRPQDRLTLVELNPKFCQMLRARHAGEILQGRVSVFEGTIESYSSPRMFDFVITTLPFNNFRPEEVSSIFDKLFSLTSVSGALTYLEYIGLRGIVSVFSSPQTRARVKAVARVYAEHIEPFIVSRDVIIVNFPPAIVYELKPHRKKVMK